MSTEPVDGSASGPWWLRSTIVEVLDRQAAVRGDQVFLYLDGRAVTYLTMRDRARRLARGFARLGVGRGDRVGVMMATCPEWVLTWFAVARLGAVIVPLNTAYRGEFLANPIADSATSVVVIDQGLMSRLEDEVLAKVPNLRFVIVRDEGDGEACTGRGPSVDRRGDVQIFPIDRLENDIQGVGAHESSSIDEEEHALPQAVWSSPAAVFYTSGTTGPSKGAVCSHHYLLSASSAMIDSWKLEPGETIYAPVPLFHLGGVVAILGPLIAGGTGVIDKVFSATHTWDRVREVGACGIVLVGVMLIMLWNQPADPRDVDLPIRFLSTAPVPQGIYLEVGERYGCKVVTSYGLSEVFPISFAGVQKDNPPGASGRANPRLEVAVVDEDDVEVPYGTVGEIVCRPREPHVMFEGYEGRPAETLGQLRNLWFHTGDLGRLDSAGNLTYVDRKKDSMRRRGENISSFEVEQSILRHPAVAEVAAIGVPSDVGEDEVMVCLATKPDMGLDMAELIDFCHGRMPSFAVPRYVRVMEELPKNATGRVLKPLLRDQGVTPDTWDRERP